MTPQAKRARLALVVAAGTATSLAALAACTTDYQLGVEDPDYGAPNALQNQRPPRPTLEGNDNSSGGGGGVTPACVTAGGTLVDGGPCDVSFSDDIMRIFGTPQAPSLACGVNDCHGGLTPPAQPAIDPGKPADTYDAFQRFSAGGKPYINPCSTNPEDSSMLCNLQPPASACGSPMPKGGGAFSAADLAAVDTWLKCGSPNN